MRTKTKIICTIGPAVDSFDKITELAEAGMNVARLNFSHGTHAEHLVTINHIKKVRQRLGIPLAIMLDTKGPEIRVGKIQGGKMELFTKHRLQLVKGEEEGTQERISVFPGQVLDGLAIGTRILFDDGYIGSHVIEQIEGGVLVEIDNGGVLASKKKVNIPDVSVDLPAITEQDLADIDFGCEQDIDMIAASFIRTPEHVMMIKKILEDRGQSGILVIAKIENTEAVQNFDTILQVADGIMVARGDLGVEVPLSHVPGLQKKMIRKSYLAGKPSVTATQMLESMINNPRPTRAEASDVANAIYDGTSAVMLSGETAVGRYPIETVKVMRDIVFEAEKDFNYRSFFEKHSKLVYHDVPSAVTLTSVKTAYSTDAKAIFALTVSGSTARLLSRLRPSMPIIALTPNIKSYHQLGSNWGVIPVLCDQCTTAEQGFAVLSDYALDHKYVSYGDLVIITAGSTFGISGTTNMIIVESIGDVLVRGATGIGKRVYGNVILLLSIEDKKPYMVTDQILVINRCSEAYIPYVKEAAGVVLQNHIDDQASEHLLLAACEKYQKSAVCRADGANSVLKQGQLVTIDPEKALIYKGVVL